VRCNDGGMKRWAAAGLAIVLVVAALAYWMRSSPYASSAEAAAARYEQGEVAVSGGRLRVVSQAAVRRLADRVIYRISWNRAGAPFDQLIVVRHMSQFGGLVSGWSAVDTGSAPGHARS
jgi:hypothetical protein